MTRNTPKSSRSGIGTLVMLLLACALAAIAAAGGFHSAKVAALGVLAGVYTVLGLAAARKHPVFHSFVSIAGLLCMLGAGSPPSWTDFAGYLSLFLATATCLMLCFPRWFPTEPEPAVRSASR